MRPNLDQTGAEQDDRERTPFSASAYREKRSDGDEIAHVSVTARIRHGTERMLSANGEIGDVVFRIFFRSS